MRFECAHCQCQLAVEINWNERSEVPVQCGKCEGISVVKSKSRMAKLHSTPPPPIQKATPPPFRATEVKVPSFLKEKLEDSIRSFDSENEADATTPTQTDPNFDTKKKWIALAGAIAILSGSYMIWNATRAAKKTYRFSQSQTETVSPNETQATIAN